MNVKNIIQNIFNNVDEKDFIIYNDGYLHVKGVNTKISLSDLLCIQNTSTNSKKSETDAQPGDILYWNGEKMITSDKVLESKDLTPIGVCVIPKKYNKNGNTTFIGLKQTKLKFYTGKDDKTDLTSYLIEDAEGFVFQIPFYVHDDKDVTLTDITNTVRSVYENESILDDTNFKSLMFNTNGAELTNEFVESDFEFEAANWCHDFVTPGTKRGDWFLPSVSELYHMSCNFNKLNESLKSVNGDNLTSSANYWSANIHDNSNAIKLHTLTRTINYMNKKNSALVRPFFELSTKNGG